MDWKEPPSKVRLLVVAVVIPPITVVAAVAGLFELILSECVTNGWIPAVGLLTVAVGSTTLAFRLCKGLAAADFVPYAAAAGSAWWVVVLLFSGGESGTATAALLIAALFAAPGLLLSMIFGRLVLRVAEMMLVGGVSLSVAGLLVTGDSGCY